MALPRIVQWDIEPIAYPLMAADGGADPAGVARTINSNEEARGKMNGGKCLARDVENYWKYCRQRSKSAVGELISKEDVTKALAIQVQQQLAKVGDRLEKQADLMDGLQEDVERLRETWGGNAADYPKAALDAINTLTRLQKEARETIRFLDNSDMKQYIKVGTLENKTGMDEVEVLDLIERIGKELGIQETDLLIAYSKVRREGPRAVGPVIDI